MEQIIQLVKARDVLNRAKAAKTPVPFEVNDAHKKALAAVRTELVGKEVGLPTGNREIAAVTNRNGNYIVKLEDDQELDLLSLVKHRKGYKVDAPNTSSVALKVVQAAMTKPRVSPAEHRKQVAGEKVNNPATRLIHKYVKANQGSRSAKVKAEVAGLLDAVTRIEQRKPTRPVDKANLSRWIAKLEAEGNYTVATIRKCHALRIECELTDQL